LNTDAASHKKDHLRAISSIEIFENRYRIRNTHGLIGNPEKKSIPVYPRQFQLALAFLFPPNKILLDWPSPCPDQPCAKIGPDILGMVKHQKG